MRKFITAMLFLALALSLAGCYKAPDAAVDGTPWDESWELLGTVIGVEAPGNGLTLLENNSALAPMDMYYATWTVGEATTITNEDGDEAQLFDAQIYLLVDGNQTVEEARTAVDGWIGQYNVHETTEITINGQDFTVVSYTFDSETNPYSRGVSAFGIYGTYAIVAEMTCVDSFENDMHTILTEFLEGCHYAPIQED